MSDTKELTLQIGKLKRDYDAKIDDCDTLIDCQRKSISRLRRVSGAEDDVAALRKERAITQAQRQAYVQARADIDSLLDYI